MKPLRLFGLACLTSLPVLLSLSNSHAGPLLANPNTDRAMYSPCVPVTLYVDLLNTTPTNFTGSVEAAITHLGYLVTNLPAQSVANLSAGASTTKVFSWLPPATDFQGYLIQISVKDRSGGVVDAGSSAVDVSSDWNRFPRYGYVSRFDADLDAYNIVWQLKNYHLNGLQFYDWQWKHHRPYTNAASWPDIAKRTISRATLTNLINAAHGYGMMAMNYNLYGGAYSNYLSDGSGVTVSMGVFSGSPASLANQMSHALPAGWATPRLYTMNNRDTNWQNYVFAREQEVFSAFPFDGWHIDSLGQNAVWDFNGDSFNLQDYHPQFINSAKAALNKRVVFNTVDAGGENQVAQNASVDFVYSELWSANANYGDLKIRVDNVRSLGSKALVLPAYLNYDKTSGYFNEASVRLADAAIFACGASHFELGDGGEMLRTEYFPENTVKMSASLKSVLRTYYDFLVGYENLLRDQTVTANNAVSISSVPTSTTGSTGAVWVISRKNLGFNLVNLVNLLNTPSTAWRDNNGAYPVPPTLTNLALKMYYTGSLGGGNLWWASPDVNAGAAAQLSFTSGSDGGGNYVHFTLPQLQYWSLAWLEIKGTNSATTRIQAENYDTMAGIGTQATTDTGGGSNVGFVNNLAGDSWVAFNNVDFTAGPASVSARVASAVSGGVVEFRVDNPAGPLLATVPVGNTGGWQSWQTITAPATGAFGVQKLFVVFQSAPANLNWFAFNVPLPSPWQTSDVGSVGVAGSASFWSGTYVVTGSGADIEGSADAFRFVFQPATGDCELRTRVINVQNTDPWAKSGVMFRDTTAAGAMNVAVVVTPGSGVAFQRRIATGGATTSMVIPGVSAPCWVRLLRSATNSFRGYYSADGNAWTQIGSSVSVPMNPGALGGLAVTAHNNATTATANFDNVTVNNAPALAKIPDRAILAGQTLDIMTSASDADIPTQTLSFALPGPLPGASINPTNGNFSWRPTIAQSPSTQTVSVVVSDSGTPSLSATQGFSVTVLTPSQPSLSPLAIDQSILLTITGDAGPDYIIQTSTDLVTWTTIFTTNSPPLPLRWSDSEAGSLARRFYRVQLAP